MDSMRSNRFYPLEPAVVEKKFRNSNFLKYYDKTPRDPKYSDVIKSLQKLRVGSDNFKNVLEALSEAPSEYDIIKVYSSDVTIGIKPFYTYINEQLYRDHEHTMSLLMPLIRRATLQINDNPPLDPCKVYRAVNMNEVDKAIFKVGHTFRFPGFISTSVSEKIARKFGDTLFAIHIDAGCLQVRDIKDISTHRAEQEYLFSPYSLFRVLGVNSKAITLQALDNMQA